MARGFGFPRVERGAAKLFLPLREKRNAALFCQQEMLNGVWYCSRALAL